MTQLLQSSGRTPVHKGEELVPRIMVRAVFVLLTVCVVLVFAARVTERPLDATPEQTLVLESRALFLSGDVSGATTILDANGSVIAQFSGEDGGFIAGVKRVIDRERMKHRVEQNGAVLLQRRQGGRLSIYDPSTKFSIELVGFGDDNLRRFARILSLG